MRIHHFPVFFLVLFLFSACNKYKAFQSNYSFKNKAGCPDYSQLDYWAAHPGKWDPADSIPKPLLGEAKDSAADVFFIHPTTYTGKKNAGKTNAVIDDAYINAKTDYSPILYQASVFNSQCRVFAPRYRQAHIKTFFAEQNGATEEVFDTAYADIRAAFLYYLANYNNTRPIIIAGHSQGALLAERLLKEFFEDKALQQQLVVAYIAGWAVPKQYFSSLKMCEDSLQTGCICSWRTFRRNYVPSYLKKENGNSFATNPLSWTTGNVHVPRKMNKGSVLLKFNKLYKNSTDAQISNGLLYVHRPKFPWSFLYFTKNYHPGDINLYYVNIRENIQQRIRSFTKKP
jgi:hypothetical protein